MTARFDRIIVEVIGYYIVIAVIASAAISLILAVLVNKFSVSKGAKNLSGLE